VTTLCILAHQDDEVAMASRIWRRSREGCSVHCAFLTDGAGHGSDSAVRNAESRAVLTSLDVPNENILFLGTEHRLADGALFRNLDRGYGVLEEATRALPLDEILCLAWEGGHPDHDASHLIALAVARRRAILENTWQFSLYNGGRSRGRLLRVMSPIDGGDIRTHRLSPAEGIRLGLLPFAYPSQRRTWLGLFPGAFLQFALLRRESTMGVSLEAPRDRPHEGRLFYERRFGVSFSEFQEATKAFRERYL
jgi:LmbE family N-acetylglucosaminyl deacetylase